MNMFQGRLKFQSSNTVKLHGTDPYFNLYANWNLNLHHDN